MSGEMSLNQAKYATITIIIEQLCHTNREWAYNKPDGLTHQELSLSFFILSGPFCRHIPRPPLCLRPSNNIILVKYGYNGVSTKYRSVHMADQVPSNVHL